MHSRASLTLAVGILAISGYAIATAWAWPWKAALFPLVIGIPVFCLALAEALWVVFGSTREASQAMDFQLSRELPAAVTVRRTVVASGWILGFFAAVLLLGFPIAVPLFVFLYLKVQGRERWGFSAVFSLAVSGLFYALFDLVLHLPFASGWIWDWLGLG